MGSVASVMWDAELAAVYDDVYAREAEPSVIEPIAGILAELAGSGAALERAVFGNAADHVGPGASLGARAARVFFFTGVSPRR
jgi:hypothetical protein